MSVAYNQAGVAYNATAVAYEAASIASSDSGTIPGDIRASVIDAISTSHVASTAGVDLSTWTNYRVFDGIAAPFGARNRGRLPFVEIQVDGESFKLDGNAIGGVRTTVRFRVNVGGSNRTQAQALGESILHAIYAAIYADSPYFAMATQEMGSFESKPYWHVLTGSLTVEHTYDPTDYGVTP